MLPRRKYGRPRIVQPENRGTKWLLGLLLMLVGVFSLVWHAFDYGRQRAGYDSGEVRAEIARLRFDLTRMTAERDRLRDQVAVLQRSGQIDRESARDAQQQLKVYQGDKLKLEQELALMRGVLSGGDANGIRVQDLKLQRGAEPRVYRYQFMLTHLTKDAETATGNVYVSVRGSQDGAARDLGLADLTPDGVDSLNMRFKYFQNLSGQIRLPEGFAPRRFVVSIKPTSKSHASVTQVFDWVVGD